MVEEKEQIQSLLTLFKAFIGDYKNLLEVVRKEREFLVQLEVSNLQECIFSKQLLIQKIQMREEQRKKVAFTLLEKLQIRNPEEKTLSDLVKALQKDHPHESIQMGQLQNTLQVLVKHVSEQNQYNKELVEKSLIHVQKMRSNVLQTNTQASTYDKKGSSATSKNPAIISREG